MKEITIRIADRAYNLKVNAADEALLVEAGRRIQEQYKARKESFGALDKQDLLAMIAFDGMVESLRLEQDTDEATKRVKSLHELITRSLRA